MSLGGHKLAGRGLAGRASTEIKLSPSRNALAGGMLGGFGFAGRAAPTAPDAVTAIISLPGPLAEPSARVDVVTVGRIALPSPLASPAAFSTVVRYELRGEVRKEGVLVDRTVRAHRLDTGAVLAEKATTGGQFRLHIGFEEVIGFECYTLALNLTAGATDYKPPIANRVTPELADDLA